MNIVGSRQGSTGGQRVRPSRLRKGTYFERHGRLYYIVDIEPETHNFLVENCSTYYREWMTGEQLEQDNILVVGRAQI